MTNTNATYATSIAVDLPDYPAATVTFTNTAFFVSGNSEVLPGKQYTLTLNSTGQGTQTLPCPDNTGDAAVNWRINLPSKESGTYAIAYDAATQQLSDILAAQSTTADPDSITAALAGKMDKVAGGIQGHAVEFASGGQVADAGFAFGTAAAADADDYDPAGSAAAAQAAAQAASIAKSGDTATGPIIVDSTNSVAFQVRKASDAGDVFSVDTQGRHVWVGAVTSPVELFEVSGEVTPGTDSFGIRSTLRSNLTAHDTTYHWAAMLAQIIQSGAYQNGAWLAAMYTYYRQDGSGTQGDVRSIAALNRINDGVANNVHGVYSDIQLNGDAQAGNVYHFRVSPTVKNGTSQVTGNEYGLYVGNLTSGALNYGVYVHENVRSRFGRVDVFGKLAVGSGFALELDDGTNSLPSFTFGNDTNTGIYRKASDNLGIACGGQNAVEIKPLQVGIGTTRGSATPAATLHLDQWLAGGAQPVLLLDQADESEEIFEIISNPGVGNAIELVGSKSLTVTEFIKVTINGNTRYIAAGTIA